MPSPGPAQRRCRRVDPRSLNRYAYVRNNPLRYTDPSGHALWAGEDVALEFDRYRAPMGRWSVREQNAIADQAFATVVDFAPGAGDAKGFIEAFTGSDLVTGESLGNWRYLGLLGISELRHLDEFSDFARALPAPKSLKALLAPVTEFANEGVIILTEVDFDTYGRKWGEHTGQIFVLTSRDADLMRNAPDIAEVGRRVGKEFPAGSALLRVDISDLASHNVRVPTEHFDERFIPGGWTSGGLPERIIDGPLDLSVYPRSKLTHGR